MNALRCLFLLLLFSLPVSVALSDEVTLDDVRAAYLKREEVVKKSITDARAKLPADATPEDLLPEKSALRTEALFHLRFFSHLERTLRMMAIDKDTRRKQLESEHLPSGEDRRIVKMWEELQAERFLQLAPPADHKKSRRQKRGDDSAEAELNERFVSRTKAITRKLEQSEGRRDTAFSKDSHDERLIEKLEKEIEEFEAQLEEMTLAYFGQQITVGFEQPYELTGDAPEQKLLADVVKSRDVLLRALRGEEPIKKDGKKSGTVADMNFESEILGVILDASGSMTNFLKPLKEEIEKDFSAPRYREVNGCALQWAIKPTGIKPDASMIAMEDLLIVQKADTIFWFSDLNDPQSEQALTRLKWLLDTSRASFYVNSVGKKPSRDLEPLITEFRKK
ncbi:hypothetical protein N9085_00120 [Akkermansiaceae bacterium]|nr:hypothetical protein [Akkermansiaceae bacterium]MDB4562159.1 hypothetical protein [Akkermansiaceae bacterium]MDB4585213.1 hypothetical protein [Akkermansiaceae bacterium]